MSDLKGIVKSEKVWVTYIIDNKSKYIITSDRDRRVYYLYEYNEEENKYIKSNHQSENPLKLEEKYIKITNINTKPKVKKSTETIDNKVNPNSDPELKSRITKSPEIQKSNKKKDISKHKIQKKGRLF